MTRLAPILALLLCATTTARAEDRVVTVQLHQLPRQVDALQPARDLVAEEGDYGTILMAAFPQGFAPDVRARMVVIAPFMGSETVMAIASDGPRYRLSEAASTQWLWRYTEHGKEQAAQFHETLRPADFRKVKLNRCTAALDRKTGDRVLTLWTQVLQRAHTYPTDPPPADSGWAYFSVKTGSTTLTAVAHEMFPGPTVTAFENLTAALSDFCNRKASIKAVNTAAATLADQLTAKKTP